MQNSITHSEITEYFKSLQANLKDSRQPKGVRHNLALVLTTMLVSMLRSVGKLNVSVIHRQMAREYSYVKSVIGADFSEKLVSDTQFRRILDGLDYSAYNSLNLAYFGKELLQEDGLWQAIDGKELRGNINGSMGEKRGENVVRAVCHESKESQILGFYHGGKESEKTVVSTYFEQKAVVKGSYSFDALHTSPALLVSINSKGGIYLAQIKKNQQHLLEDCQEIDLHLQAHEEHYCYDKSHGREEQRKARIYSVNPEGFEQRWHHANMKTLVVVDKICRNSKTGKSSNETAYFLSNQALGKLKGIELFQAVRGHWGVEADNWVRDATLGEDQIRCKKSNQIRAIASAINNLLNIFRGFDVNNNIRAFRESLIFDRSRAIACLAPKKVL